MTRSLKRDKLHLCRSTLWTGILVACKGHAAKAATKGKMSQIYRTGIGYTSTISFRPQISIIPFCGMISGPIDTILNLVLFVPLGFFLPLLYKKYQHIKNVILTGFLFSLSIEIVQMFGWGATDINDLIINTAGACLGYLIYYLVSKILPINFRKRLQSENVNDMVEIMLYAIYIFIVMITVQPWVIHSLLNIG